MCVSIYYRIAARTERIANRNNAAYRNCYIGIGNAGSLNGWNDQMVGHQIVDIIVRSWSSTRRSNNITDRDDNICIGGTTDRYLWNC